MQGSLSDSDWKLLLHRIKEGRCTPFLGAGASFPALPLGGGLAEQWSSEHSYPLADRTDLPRVAQYLAVTRGDHMYPKERVADSFKGRGAGFQRAGRATQRAFKAAAADLHDDQLR